MLEISYNGARTREYYTEEVLGPDQAEVLAVGLNINKNENCDITVCTDSMLIAKRYSEGKISSSIEVEIWVVARERWERGYGPHVRWVER